MTFGLLLFFFKCMQRTTVQFLRILEKSNFTLRNNVNLLLNLKTIIIQQSAETPKIVYFSIVQVVRMTRNLQFPKTITNLISFKYIAKGRQTSRKYHYL